MIDNSFRRRKCSEFYCLQVYTYPDKVKGMGFNKKTRSDDPNWIKMSMTLSQQHLDFKDKLLKQIFGVGLNFFTMNYMCFTSEAISEFLEVWHNIRTGNQEGYYQYLVPIEHTSLINWMKNNKPQHSREPKRYRIDWMSWMHQRSEFHFVNDAIRFSKEQRQKIKSLPPLELLTEENKLSLC